MVSFPTKEIRPKIARAINDGGAIVGTATYTPQGTNDTNPAGPHGVMLLPIEIDHEITVGSGNYEQISTLPIFQPNDGVGRGVPAATDTPGVSLTATNDANGAITGFSGTITTSMGSFTGSLSPTANNPLVFSDADNIVTVTLPSGVALSNSAVNTLQLYISGTSLGLSNVPFTLVETTVASDVFVMPIYSCTFAPNSQNTSATLSFACLATNADGLPDYSTPSYTLNQTSSNVYSDAASGTTVTITSSSSSSGLGTNNVVLSGGSLPSQGVPLTLIETGNGTSIFYYGSNSNPGTNETPDNPSITGDGTFYIRLKGMGTGSQQFTLTSDVDSISTTFSPDPNDSAFLRSDPLLLVPQGSNTSFGSILKVLHVPAPTLTSNWAPTINLAMPSQGNPGMRIQSWTGKPGLYVGIGVRPGDPVFAGNDPKAPAGKAHYPNHLPNMLELFGKGSLKLLGDFDYFGAMTQERMMEAVGTHTAWYSFDHGVEDTHGQFAGIQTYDLQTVTSSTIQSWIHNQKYTFVFLNGCKTADGGSGSTAMSQSWNCKAYIGNTDNISPLRCMNIGEEFATGPGGNLTISSSLGTFIQKCSEDNPVDPHPYEGDIGVPNAMSGANAPMSQLGF